MKPAWLVGIGAIIMMGASACLEPNRYDPALDPPAGGQEGPPDAARLPRGTGESPPDARDAGPPDAAADPDGGAPDGAPAACLEEACELKVRELSLYSGLTCALLADGSARCWGRWPIGPENVPVQDPQPTAPSGPAGIKAMGIGGSLCAIDLAGAVWCWLKSVHLPSSDRLVPVTGLPPAASVGVGGAHVCALVAGGKVLCWGGGSAITGGAHTPLAVPGVSGASQLAAGTHTCALVEGGAVLCWNGYFSTSGLQRLDLPPASAITAGQDVACALTTDGAVYCWGRLPFQSEFTFEPRRVAGLGRATSVSASWSHACAVVEGSVFCWGGNGYGQLGDGTTADSLNPVRARVTGAAEVHVGDSSTCALLASGSVRCWGSNYSDQLGPAGRGQKFSTVPLPIVVR